MSCGGVEGSRTEEDPQKGQEGGEARRQAVSGIPELRDLQGVTETRGSTVSCVNGMMLRTRDGSVRKWG